MARSKQSGERKPVGYTADDRLAAFHDVQIEAFARDNNFHFYSPAYSLPASQTFMVYGGDDALERWKKAVNAINLINQLDLEYPKFGIKFPKREDTVNSNSVYRTFSEIMGIELHRFQGYTEIGIEQSLYSYIESMLENNDNNRIRLS